VSSIEVAAGIGILGVFVLGIVIGIVLVVSFASRREDRLYSLWRLLGVWVRGARPERAFQFDEDGRVLRREPLR
jgi:hypothetical protein